MMFAWLLVLVSAFTGHPMALVFSSPLEIVAIAAVVFAVNAVTARRRDDMVRGRHAGVDLRALGGLAFYFV